MRLLIIPFVLIVMGCTNNKGNDPSIDELTALARTSGDEISTLAQKTLGGQLKQAISEQGVTYAVEFCNVAALPILDSLEFAPNAILKRASLRVRNEKDEPTKVERVILEQYAQSLESGGDLSPVVEVLNEREILYAKPILLDSPVCLNCHGQAVSQVAPETLKSIQQLYPNDNALNHKMGDLRGIWSVTFDVAELTNYLKNIK
ncbi:Tll0287-like domain-containing protein [Roseivirga echinicomitans]